MFQGHGIIIVFMQLTRDLFAIAKFLLSYAANKQTDKRLTANRQYHKMTRKLAIANRTCVSGKK